MDAGNGRFVSRDSFARSLYVPQSQNRFAYAHGNPVNNIDPSGFTSLTELVVAFGQLALVSSFAQAAFGRVFAGTTLDDLFWDAQLYTFTFGVPGLPADFSADGSILYVTAQSRERFKFRGSVSRYEASFVIAMVGNSFNLAGTNYSLTAQIGEIWAPENLTSLLGPFTFAGGVSLGALFGVVGGPPVGGLGTAGGAIFGFGFGDFTGVGLSTATSVLSGGVDVFFGFSFPVDFRRIP